jgi:hypothetical protein
MAGLEPRRREAVAPLFVGERRDRDGRAVLLDAVSLSVSARCRPADDPEEAVAYAFDLIFDNEDESDPIAAAIHDVYRDGPPSRPWSGLFNGV